MTVHVLHAGDGYTYLTRQVAAADHTLSRGQTMADYYTAEGNPPGRWIGRGLPQVGVHGVVSEMQMKALFGEGRHPDTDRIMQEAAERIAAKRELTAAERKAHLNSALAATRLGRAFPIYEDSAVSWRERCATAYRRREEVLNLKPGSLEEWERRRVSLVEGARLFQERHRRRPQDVTEVRRFITAEARPAKQPVSGYDLVFTPVKSVSVLWALGDHDVRQAVEQAHHAAMKDALGYIEDHAALTRVGAGGIAQIETKGLIGTAFDHYDSRCGDPNLHTHAAISTKVQGVDGKWRSLDGRVLHHLAVSASETYNTRVEDELRARLGVRFGERSGGRNLRPVREIQGLSEELLKAFSNRRAGIEQVYEASLVDYRNRYGHDAPQEVRYRLAQEATLETRGEKSAPKSLADHRHEWRTSADAVLGHDGVNRALEAALSAPQTNLATEWTPERLDRFAKDAVDVVAENRATWTRWHLKAEAERVTRAVPVSSPADRAGLVDAVLLKALNDHSVRIVAPLAAATPTLLQRSNGESVTTVHGAEKFTSQAILDAEDRLVTAARTPVATGTSGQLFERVTGQLLGSGELSLDAWQIEMARVFACDGQLLVAGIGPAGTGKTTSMRLLSRVVEADARRVVALAPSARAAKKLGEEVEVEVHTIHGFLAQVEKGEEPLLAGDVVVIDEAGMAGTLNLDRVVQHASSRGAVVRLLGDPRQLAAVESGGALRLVERELGAARLDALHRFSDPAEATATLGLRLGDVSSLDFYEADGRVVGGTREHMLDEVFAAWKADDIAGKSTAMMAVRRQDVQELAVRARLHRIASGKVEIDGVTLHDGTRAGRGDVVVTRMNNRELRVLGGRDHVKNGDSWRVEQRNGDGSLDVRHAEHGGRLRLPVRYVQEHTELAYAATVHRLQGSTVDTAHLLADPSMTRESLYVGMTRGRDSNRVYVVEEPVLTVDVDQPAAPLREPREVLEAILSREGAELSATQTIQETLAAAESLATLAPEYEYAQGLLTNAAHYVDIVGSVLGAHAESVAEDGAWPALASALAKAEAAGLDAASTLRRVVGRRELVTAESTAQVLHWRVHRYLDATARLVPSDEHEFLPRWLSTPPRASAGQDERAELIGWVAGRGDQIRARVRDLAEQVDVTRPAWAGELGTSPSEPVKRDTWLSAVGQVAAYREQFCVTSDDPSQPLGEKPARGGLNARAWSQARGELSKAQRLSGGAGAPSVTEQETKVKESPAAMRQRAVEELAASAYRYAERRAQERQELLIEPSRPVVEGQTLHRS